MRATCCDVAVALPSLRPHETTCRDCARPRGPRPSPRQQQLRRPQRVVLRRLSEESEAVARAISSSTGTTAGRAPVSTGQLNAAFWPACSLGNRRRATSCAASKTSSARQAPTPSPAAARTIACRAAQASTPSPVAAAPTPSSAAQPATSCAAARAPTPSSCAWATRAT
jgi:hypothetical protein